MKKVKFLYTVETEYLLIQIKQMHQTVLLLEELVLTVEMFVFRWTIVG